MRHPFDGINPLISLDENRGASTSPELSRRMHRRSVVTQLFAATFAALTAGLSRKATAQTRYYNPRRGRPTTYALGEEGGGYPRRHTGPTTARLGEEGGVTTYATGEEGGATTYALGEEGGVTTYAIGEEGGGVTTYAVGEEGGATTFAIGEEGGITSRRRR